MKSYTFADPAVRTQSLHVQNLAEDLARIRHGYHPSPEELDAAPLIDGWSIGVRAEPVLIGTISGHPIVNGLARTSGLYILDINRGYARTMSRFYRLGQEAGQ